MSCIPITDVAWFRGPTLLEDDGELVEILRTKDRHILRLYDVQKSGLYSCTALNAFGEASHQFRLSIQKSTTLFAYLPHWGRTLYTFPEIRLVLELT